MSYGLTREASSGFQPSHIPLAEPSFVAVCILHKQTLRQSLEHMMFIRGPHLLKGRGRKQDWAEESQPVFQARSSSANPAPGHQSCLSIRSQWRGLYPFASNSHTGKGVTSGKATPCN